MYDHYLTDLVFRWVKSDIRNLITSDQFISHVMIKLLPRLNSHRSSFNTHETKKEALKQLGDRFKPKGQERLELLLNRGGSKQKKVERDSVQTVKTGLNKTEMSMGMISHNMKRHSGNSNFIPLTGQRISPENRTKNQLNWP